MKRTLWKMKRLARRIENHHDFEFWSAIIVFIMFFIIYGLAGTLDVYTLYGI